MGEIIHPIDRIVGRNVRMMRALRGMSQTALGQQVGVTFQQIQKYEKGTNRVSASMLFEIAKVLDADVKSFFVEALPSSDDQHFAVPVAETFGTKLDLQIMQKLFEVRDARVKRQILELLDAIIDGQRDPAGEDRGSSASHPDYVG
ncbi:anaerobic benzoate catabolism transcriptional regulator [Hartmannibacter diazotrophicus]|uniref:Anaerobic benzoate catabolism transcriptional regulator n=1 Tax=Hartmannibacter diazotrophicus TaxID=1482074 RepID=A0A2C9D8L0_9HYPH|nr:helix-turn-helix transcriptional regulator [Hartmannibacter diazotrophicus]SON56081.1 anaerobic benzoate catabolism transcriptional regulator [Hartmannibacter diazotrophicus]